MSQETTYTTQSHTVKPQGKNEPRTYTCSLRVGGQRCRVCADMSTIMLLVRLAFGAKQAGRA